MTEASLAIEARSLTKYFGAVCALDGVDLTVDRGEVFGLLGRNGAGKTTLVRILLGLVFASGGDGRLLGRSLGAADALREVGYLPEDHSLPDYHTAESSLHFFGALSGVPRRERQRRIGPLLERLDLESWRTTKIRTFSKGMRQRLGLAQALLHEPRLLFLDEPTDGVDPVGRKEIRDLLRDYRDNGGTVFLNSHLLGEVELVCDRVAIARDGVLDRVGTIAELTRGREVWRFRVEGELDACRAALGEVATTIDVDDDGAGFAATVPDTAGLDALVDVLRSAGVGIRGLAQDRPSLEDVFIEVVGQGRTGGRRT